MKNLHQSSFLEDWNQVIQVPKFRKALWIGGVVVTIGLLCAASQVMERRVEMSAVGLNVWSSGIRKAQAQISTEPERWTAWGSLEYGYEATHEMLYHVPPQEVRVYWEAPEGTFDRLVRVENDSVIGQTNDLILLYELDSRCGRARVSWKKDMEEVSKVAPWDKVVERDCNLYKDQPTPNDAGPLPNWR